MRKERARMAVYGMAGFYLLYLAVDMFRSLDTMTENRMFFMGFMVFFAIAGAAMMGFSIRYAYNESRKPAEEQEEAADPAEEESEHLTEAEEDKTE